LTRPAVEAGEEAPGNAANAEIDVDDLPLKDGLRLGPLTAGEPEALVSSGKIVMEQPGEIQI
jgi:hypothetical protein